MVAIKITEVNDGEMQLRQIQRDSVHNQAINTKSNITLVLFFGWLYAKQGALEKYFNLYHEKGFDVLFVPGHLKHFCWPSYSFTLADAVLKYVRQQTDDYKFILVHAMSIGAYNYTSCLISAQENPEVHQNYIKKVQGIIFDSLTIGSTERMRTGVGIGISKNSIIRSVIPGLLSLYFFLTRSKTVDVFEDMVEKFKKHPAKVPTLFFYSRDDPMCDANTVDELVKSWTNLWNFPVLKQCWEQSIHAGHFLEHKDIYLKFFDDFFKIFVNRCHQKIVSEQTKSKL